MLNYKLPAFAENGFVNCFDAAIMAVVYHSFDHFDWLLAMFWGFIFDKEMISKPLWKRFITGGLYRTSRDYYQALYKLKLEEWTFDDAAAGIPAMIRPVKQDVPVILSIDTYECPWNAGYRKIHCEHFIVLTDYIASRREFICHDFYNRIEKVSLSYDSVYRMSAIRFFTADQFHDNPVKYAKVNELLYAVSVRYLSERASDNIMSFADSLKDNDVFHQLQSVDLNVVCLDPFFIRFQGFLSSRRNFLYFLKSQSSIFPSHIIDNMQIVCSEIANSFLLLLKYVHQNGDEKIKYKACDLLMKAATVEESIAESIATISC